MPVRSLLALLACLVFLPACDSGGTSVGVDPLSGFTGNRELIGVWEQDNAEPPFYLVVTFERASRETELLYTVFRDELECWES